MKITRIPQGGNVEATANNLAYLVIREGASWTDVFRLTPGRTVTIGRASTNQIVIKDERASRCHAEVFHTGGQWTIRDLDSRNGTTVGGQAIRGDHQLLPGEVVRIAHTQLAFVHDLSKAFADVEENDDVTQLEHETVSGAFVPHQTDPHVLDTFEPTLIIIVAARHVFSNRTPTKISVRRKSVALPPSCAAWRSPWQTKGTLRPLRIWLWMGCSKVRMSLPEQSYLTALAVRRRRLQAWK